MNLLQKLALTVVTAGSLVLAASAAFAQVSSIESTGNGGQASGCLSPTDSCNTAVSGATLKSNANGNQLNGNNPTATSTSAGGGGGTGGSGKAVANPTAEVIQNNPAPNQLQVGVRFGGTAYTPPTLGQGGEIELICGNRRFRIVGVVKSEAQNFLGLFATGNSTPETLNGSKEVLDQSVECSELEQIKAVQDSGIEAQIAYIYSISAEKAMPLLKAKLFRLGLRAEMEELNSILAQTDKNGKLLPTNPSVGREYAIGILMIQQQQLSKKSSL